MPTCNVCGTETRCYSLTERDLSRPSPVMGMIFYICSNCLSKAFKPKHMDDPATTPSKRIPGGLPDKPDRVLES